MLVSREYRISQDVFAQTLWNLAHVLLLHALPVAVLLVPLARVDLFSNEAGQNRTYACMHAK